MKKLIYDLNESFSKRGLKVVIIVYNIIRGEKYAHAI